MIYKASKISNGKSFGDVEMAEKELGGEQRKG